jgi:hypothetical protein
MPDKNKAMRALWFQTSCASLLASKFVQCGVVPAELVAQHQYQVAGHVEAFATGALFLAARQRSLQYKTWSQFLAQLFRQLMGRPQTRQGFWGKSCLFPLKPEGLVMVLSLSARAKVTI